MGPKRYSIRPSAVLPYPMVRMITSRSSPWTRSRFLTKKGSLRAWLGCGAVEEGVEVLVVGPRAAQRLLDAVGVLDAHRDNAQRCIRPGPGVVGDKFGDPDDLVGDGVLLPGTAGPERH